MPLLPNPKEERAAQFRAGGKSQLEAIVLAGYARKEIARVIADGKPLDVRERKNLDSAAAKIFAKPIVKARVLEITQQTSQHAIEVMSETKIRLFQRANELWDRSMANTPITKQGKNGQFEPILEQCVGKGCTETHIVGVYEFDGRVAVKTLETIGKWTGMDKFDPSRESHDPFASMKVEDIADYIVELVQRIGMEQRVMAALGGVDGRPNGSGEPSADSAGDGESLAFEAEGLPAVSETS